MRSRTAFARQKASPGARQPESSRSSSQPERSASQSLLSRAIALLARRDHSRAELARKLARYVDDESGELPRVLDELERSELIS
ncbi:MAG: recombination regulator RecX, partial [Burkholderiaceae bacterium]